MNSHCLLTKAVVGLAALAAAGQTWAGDTKDATGERTRVVRQRVDTELPSLVALYKHLHSHPELSLREEGAAFVPRYLELLSAGGSDAPHVLLGKLGVDVNDPAFWELGLRLLDDMVAEAEELASKV